MMIKVTTSTYMVLPHATIPWVYSLLWSRVFFGFFSAHEWVPKTQKDWHYLLLFEISNFFVHSGVVRVRARVGYSTVEKASREVEEGSYDYNQELTYVSALYPSQQTRSTNQDTDSDL